MHIICKVFCELSFSTREILLSFRKLTGTLFPEWDASELNLLFLLQSPLLLFYKSDMIASCSESVFKFYTVNNTQIWWRFTVRPLIQFYLVEIPNKLIEIHFTSLVKVSDRFSKVILYAYKSILSYNIQQLSLKLGRKQK